ncbi:hypothetical protein EC604_01775 [Paenibacillus amylolyticus]|uniref:GP-PDE domain-containing protein n=1 Tax=Paenibacillus amylolyticus TaxID=1451 RepID=A0A5M9WLY8_PAEAM|nr:hypothetical protein EC604_01775 [Paenibacillus amylolyticus]
MVYIVKVHRIHFECRRVWMEQHLKLLPTEVHLRYGRLVLIHDETLQRTAGSEGWVKDCTFDTLRTLDAGSWFHSDFAGEAIPSLEMLFNLVQGKRILLNVELKNGIVPYKGMEEKVIQVIREWNMEQQVVLSSFNHASLVKCKRIAPDIRTALLYMEKL